MPPIFTDLLDRIDQSMAKASAKAFAAELAGVMPRLRSYAHSLVRDRDAAEDLVQETLLKAWAARASFQADTNFRAWMSTILRNIFFSQQRRARFHGEYDEFDAERRLATPERQSAHVELNDVLGALERLPDTQQEALRLVAIDGVAYDQAAAMTGISLPAFKSRVARGRAGLQALLQGEARLPVSMSAESAAAVPIARGSPVLRGAWAAAKAAGRPLMIG